jgi:hypothetical protein
MYCLKHVAELECYGWGEPAKPKCPQPECGGRHATGAHELLGEVNASINLIAGEDYESDEDEEWWVNIVRVEQEGESQQEFDDPGMELDEEESEGEADDYCPSVCMRRDDSGLEDELEYFWDVSSTPEVDGGKENRWWSPGPQGLESEEEDEEETQYLISLLMSEPKGESNREEATQSQDGTEAGPSSEDRQASAGESERRGTPGRPPQRGATCYKKAQKNRAQKKEGDRPR